MKKGILVLLLLIYLTDSKAQSYITYIGKVLDLQGQPLSHVSTTLISKNGNKTVVTDGFGVFVFKNLNTKEFEILYHLIGFKSQKVGYKIEGKKQVEILTAIRLSEETFRLKEVSIIGSRKRIEIKKDTIQYNSEHYLTKEGSTAGDILKKIPGSIFTPDGRLLILGQSINKVRINGKDYLDGELTNIVSNIPSEIIDNIQLINDYGFVANITGNRAGPSEKIINLNLKDKIMGGYFGNASTGYGTDERYIVDGSATFQDKQQQLALTGNLNNTNLSRGGSGLYNLTDMSNGDNVSKSLGANYQNQLSKNLILYGSYSINSNKVKSQLEISRQTIYSDYSIFSNETSYNTNNSKSKRGAINLEYKLGKNDYLKLSPEVELMDLKNESVANIRTNNKTYQTEIINQSNNESRLPKFGGSIIYNKTFSKKGRNATLSYLRSSSKEEINRLIDNRNDEEINDLIKQKSKILTKNQQNNFNAGYIEPLSNVSFIDAAVSYNHSKTESNVNTTLIGGNTQNSISGDNLNDNYQSSFTTTTLSTGYRLQNKISNLSLGISVINSQLIGISKRSQINTSLRQTNYSPNLRLAISVSKESSISAEYNGISSAPSIDQLLPIRDLQNIQNIVIGNPDLKPEFRNTGKIYYTTTEVENGKSFYIGFEISSTSNKIVQSRTSNLETLVQQTSYNNVSGAIAKRLSYSWTIPLKNAVWMLIFNGSSDQSNNISYLNGKKDIGKSWMATQQILVKSILKEGMENLLNLEYNLNQNKYPNSGYKSTLSTLKMGLIGTYAINAKTNIGYDLSKNINYGYTSAMSTNPFIMNFYFEQTFFKHNSTSIKLMGLDLLNQNTGISNDVFSNTISNTKSNRLSRYFMMTLKYRFQNMSQKT